MREHLGTALIAIGIFLGGLLSGVWIERSQPIPPPPIPVLGEFSGIRIPPQAFAPVQAPRVSVVGAPAFEFDPRATLNPEEFRARLRTHRAESAEFKRRIDEIEDDFRARLEAILSPEQREQLSKLFRPTGGAWLTPMPPPMAKSGPVAPPLAIPAFGSAGSLSPSRFVSIVIYRPLLDRMTEELQLDVRQQDAARQLLIERRERTIALVDEMPPPSLRLGQILRGMTRRRASGAQSESSAPAPEDSGGD